MLTKYKTYEDLQYDIEVLVEALESCFTDDNEMGDLAEGAHYGGHADLSPFKERLVQINEISKKAIAKAT